MDNANICERVDDLIGFLYGELSELEARRFERHLSECAPCKGELASFGQIRESIVEWRNEAIGLATVPSSAIEPIAAEARRPARSALAALREFFALSPFWMRGATAFAGVLFCICAVFAVAYLKGRQPVNVAVTDKRYSEKEFQDKLAAELQRKPIEAAPQNVIPINTSSGQPDKQQTIKRSGNEGQPEVAEGRNARRPFTRQERQELAADLRLVSAKDDDDLDLNGEANRPTP